MAKAQTKIDFDDVPPSASAMMEALRAFGYELQTAIADLIDNSIFAGAKNVRLNVHWEGENSSISIVDDGIGMSEETLREAMRLGSRNPLEARDPKDLGRFGLGMKTASLSQCRCLTVCSKQKGSSPAIRRWDLDHIASTNEWHLLKEARETSGNSFECLDSMESGTVVLWEFMDRLVGGMQEDKESDHKLFLDHIATVKAHLAMVFHRYMQTPDGLKIWINTIRVEPWDPYLQNEDATQRPGEESLKIHGETVNVRPYVLPHHSKIEKRTHEIAAGPNGWNAHQGFYIYRNKRLLLPGDWLGLGFKKEEHFKLARIQVDIPNSLDFDWHIDVRKSKAKPPLILRRDLKRIAKLTRQLASDIYRHRGKVISREGSSDHIFCWQKKVKHGKIFYSVNRDIPLVKDLIGRKCECKPKVKALLRLLEETVPVSWIVMNNSKEPDSQSIPFEDTASEELLILMQVVYESMISSGMTSDEAKIRLIRIEPFDRFPEVIAAFFENITGETDE